MLKAWIWKIWRYYRYTLFPHSYQYYEFMFIAISGNSFILQSLECPKTKTSTSSSESW